jgi:hypothetical protein
MPMIAHDAVMPSQPIVITAAAPASSKGQASPLTVSAAHAGTQATQPQPSAYRNCAAYNSQPLNAAWIAAAEKAGQWATNICKSYDSRACITYGAYLNDCAGGDIVMRWYNNGRPDDVDVPRWLCEQKYDSPLHWKAYPVDTITPKPFFYTFDGNRIEVPYVGVQVRRNGEHYIAQLALGSMGGVVPVWNGLPPVDPGCLVPGAACRLWFKAPCMVEGGPVVVEQWIPAEAGRVRPSGSSE